MSKKPTVLLIMDGFGLNDRHEANAVYEANTPNIDKLMKECPFVKGNASGLAVGLPDGQMGNSEVGHLNMGAGRIVYQELTRITKAIQDGDFFDNKAFLEAVENCKKNNSTLHLYGLLSDGGVHSHNTHLYALLELAKRQGLTDVCVHCFLDGRDTAPTSGKEFIEELEAKIKEIGVGQIASIEGRYYAMDRDNRWERVEKAYNAMVIGTEVREVKKVWYDSQKNDITDEFIVPTTTDRNGLIRDNDGIIFFNFRPDRLRELGSIFTNDNYECFNRDKINNLKVVTMMKVTDTVLCPMAFEHPVLNNTIGEYISSKGLTQLRIAETEKYAHVTYFINGGSDVIFEGEKRILVPSPKVATYDLEPEMSANMITASLVKEITENKEDLIILNFANGDMVGHTGDYNAAVKAVETVDSCIGKILDNISLDEYTMIVTADHGNCEVMRNKDGSVNTSHTTNRVPFIITDKRLKLLDGSLCDIAPSVLFLMGLDIPKEMTGNILIKNRKKVK